jgi:hypothetical protein
MDIANESKRFGAQFVEALDGRDFAKAKEISRDAVAFFKRLLSDEVVPPSSRAAVLYHAVMFRGLFDYAELIEHTSQEGWETDNPKIEVIWLNLCDCSDRISFVQPAASGRIFEKIFSRLQALEDWFAARFGTGVYSSPEILVKRELCSICNQDIRRCDHIAGHVYEGRICYGVPEDISLESSSIVQVPHDRRCRIWPWQLKGGVASGIVLFTFFRVDDFLARDDWHERAR